MEGLSLRFYKCGMAINTARGSALLVLSAVAFSTAGFFTREAPIDLWAMIFWRNLFGTLALTFVVALTSRASPPEQWRIGTQQLALIAFAAFGTVTYLAAFKYTSVANISSYMRLLHS